MHADTSISLRLVSTNLLARAETACMAGVSVFWYLVSVWYLVSGISVLVFVFYRYHRYRLSLLYIYRLSICSLSLSLSLSLLSSYLLGVCVWGLAVGFCGAGFLRFCSSVGCMLPMSVQRYVTHTRYAGITTYLPTYLRGCAR